MYRRLFSFLFAVVMMFTVSLECVFAYSEDSLQLDAEPALEVSENNGRVVIDFCMFKNKIDTMMPTENGITVHEKDFPDILLSVAVNLNDGKGEILFKTDKVIR